MNSEVFVNGNSLGVRPYGYSSFRYDLTPYLKWGERNVLAVKVDNSTHPNSRWYSGSGIYRNVWLTVVDPVHVGHWGTFVTTPEVTGEKAVMEVRTMVKKANIPLEDAVRMASETPARLIGVDDRKGTLAKGKDADIVILDKELNVRCVWSMGKIVPGTDILLHK